MYFICVMLCVTNGSQSNIYGLAISNMKQINDAIPQY